MKAAYIHEVGPAENIVYGDLPQPELKGSHVLVKVAAVSVNPVDTYIRAGKIAWSCPSRSSWGATWPAPSKQSGRMSRDSSRATGSGAATRD